MWLQEIRCLKTSPEPHQIRLRDVGPMVRCKVVELPLNYHVVMLRYQFCTPGKGGMDTKAWKECCWESIKMWTNLLIAEKRRQMRSDELRPAFLP